MVHLLTWPRIRLVVRAATIYTPLRGRKHHFRWLLRWRNLPVRANPHGLLRLTAYLRFASCLSTPGWMCIGIEYRQTASFFLFTRLEIFCPFLWNLRPDRSCHFSVSPLSFLLQPSSCACAISPFSSLVFASLSSIRSQESLRLVLSVERGISAMLRLLSRIWVTIQLRAVEGSRPAAFFESTGFLNISSGLKPFPSSIFRFYPTRIFVIVKLGL